jgi:hypothetical protein
MNRILSTCVLGMASASAMASVPAMGGGMSHILVTVFEQQVYLSFESPEMSTVELQNYDESYNGSASVLDNTGYNSQFGWLANGFISLPPASGIFVRTLHSSPYLDVYSENGYDPILGIDGSNELWEWDGTMTHNWYSSRVMGGTHTALYEVFVGDLSGQPLAGYGAGQIQLSFTYGDDRGVMHYGTGDVVGAVPAPSVGGVLVLGMIAGTRRRR